MKNLLTAILLSVFALATMPAPAHASPTDLRPATLVKDTDTQKVRDSKQITLLNGGNTLCVGAGTQTLIRATSCVVDRLIIGQASSNSVITFAQNATLTNGTYSGGTVVTVFNGTTVGSYPFGIYLGPNSTVSQAGAAANITVVYH